MINFLFVFALGGLLAIVFNWGFRTLQKERWQILGAVPTRKIEGTRWQGLNLTYYGFFNAWALAVAVAVFLMLMGAAGVPVSGILAMIVPILLVCLPASKAIAAWVEKKPSTFSIGGASFAGILLAPWLVGCVQKAPGMGSRFPVDIMVGLSALTTAYAIGEGIGRLACVSYGCCYGKPMADLHPFFQRLFRHHAFTFYGKTKKIAYASGWEGKKILPVQALTAALNSGVGLGGIFLFLQGKFTAAFLLTLVLTQTWRFLSEFLRADYRGQGKLSAYQKMSLGAIGYALAVAWFFPVGRPMAPDIISGLKTLWQPGMILFIELLWLIDFLYTGRSQVTESVLSFQVRKDRI